MNKHEKSYKNTRIEIQKNKYFLQFDTLDEILDELILKSESESPKVSKENESLILKISLSSSKFKDIEFILKPKSKNTEDKFKELYNMVTELKKENINLKQRLNKLEDENSQIKEQMKILIDFKNEIKKEKEKEKENDKKNLKMDSNILNDDQHKKNKIKEFICHDKKVSAELKYRLTRDGADFNTFHNLCDNISPNLLLIKDDKDVDGFSEGNLFAIRDNNEKMIPCTVKGILKLLDYYKIDLEGKNVVVIGRSNIVGRPLADALINRNATVTLAHSKTKDLQKHTKRADIVVAAVGKPNLVTKDMVRKGFIGIDVGINVVDGKLVGDFSKEVEEKASYLTPVPGGVGPMTVAMIIDNLIDLAKQKKK